MGVLKIMLRIIKQWPQDMTEDVFSRIKWRLSYKYKMNACQGFYLAYELTKEPVGCKHWFKGEPRSADRHTGSQEH